MRIKHSLPRRCLSAAALCLFTAASAAPLDEQVKTGAAKVEAQVIAWRRDFHQHPELSNREVETAAKVAAHLKALGFDEVEMVHDVLPNGVSVGFVRMTRRIDATPHHRAAP